MFLQYSYLNLKHYDKSSESNSKISNRGIQITFFMSVYITITFFPWINIKILMDYFVV